MKHREIRRYTKGNQTLIVLEDGCVISEIRQFLGGNAGGHSRLKEDREGFHESGYEEADELFT